ncbi:hypothetical protein Cob_v008066 [Colletotrichum orbiculare MAFF 240422]|uniref:Uncharacterized protein n=1 Tax=Colletotrichum orbiculare (strain 104-T / ATCC 96160 / CBS 514.97 / LARS 414 / MAFF 240422) TaxID=1213857 RepID=N4VGA2_COLOR|nr:hypothetical protein Cob_v008066 [Colletotrichum orbiculare MAFF 240422]
MMSPRSFLYYNRQPSASTTPKPASPSPPFITRKPTANSFATSSSSTTTSPNSLDTPRTALPSASLDRIKDAQNVSVTVTPIPALTATTPATMAKTKNARRETSKLAPPSPPRTTTSVTTRPTTPTGPVQIPTKTRSNPFHSSHRHSQKKSSRPRDVHSPETVPPAMLALLAVTDIPRPRRSLKQKLARDQPMTLEAVIQRQQVCEKELSLTFGKNPLDLLLSPPEYLEDDDLSISDSGLGSLSTRTVSVESMPSLGDSFSTDTLSSLESPYGSSPRRKRSRQPRRSLEPISSPPGEPEAHPLSPERDVEGLDFRVFDESQDDEDTKSEFSFSDYTFPLRPLKSAFKSNLTASLRALRSAARSISNINFSSIPPDDFLTRSILTIDPKVPYTDERRPPVLEEEPSAALRRYLNPTTNARIEPHPSTAAAAPTGTRSFTASIQMQTYKVQRSRSAPAPSSRGPSPTTSAVTTQSTTPYQPPAQSPTQTAFTYPPGGMRQREMRENPDFIRIAVMEMAMRKRGKLDDQRPGRARWALPPRKQSVRAYEVGADGVPARWIPVSH